MVKESVVGRNVVFRETFNSYESILKNGGVFKNNTVTVSDGSIDFDTTDHITYHKSYDVQNDEFSVRLIFTPNSLDDDVWRGVISCYGPDGSGNYKGFDIIMRRDYVRTTLRGTSSIDTSSTYVHLGVGVEVELVMVFTSSYIKTYKDGVLVGTKTGTWSGGFPFYKDLMIGGRGGSYDMDSVMTLAEVYDRVLTAEEISALYDGDLYNNPINYVGNELITNGSFDTDSDWTKGTGWEITSGHAKFTGTTLSDIRQNAMVENKYYKVEFDVLSNEGSGINSVYIGSTNRINNAHLETGHYTFEGQATGNSTLYIYGRPNEEFIIDNVSVKEVKETGFRITADNGTINDSEGAEITNTGLIVFNDGGKKVMRLSDSNHANFSYALKDTKYHTFRFWVKGKEKYGTQLLSKYNNSDNSQKTFRFLTAQTESPYKKLQLSFFGDAADGSICEVRVENEIFDNEWHRVIITFDGDQTGKDRVTAYVDGVEQELYAHTQQDFSKLNTDSVRDLIIGYNNLSTNHFIDDFSYTPYHLDTAEEAARDYNSKRGYYR